ncbi:MAG: PQQ-dependent sugar dehydrogenase [Anaerolineales bacterium]|nr:PQQ-dependent sugar dehydrogenase [Anaerolineales bacterium]
MTKSRSIRLGAALTLGLLLAACGGGTPTVVAPPPELPTQSEAQPSAPADTQAAAEPEDTAAPEQPSGDVEQLPDAAGYTWGLVASGFNSPIFLTHSADNSGRLFVVEQPGRIWVLPEDGAQPALFLDIRSRVGSRGNEQGLLGLAFHPKYVQNGYFYVNYTDSSGDTVIARYSSVPGGDEADPGSEAVLLRVAQPYPNHNGGHLEFGLDGYLYIALGDGGSGGDPLGAGQSLDTHLGKLLRIDVDGGDPYAIPEGNGPGLPEIWAYGLRNSWRFSFDTATGDLYIGDVGQNAWEEINFLPGGSAGGANFGWNFYEGSHPYQGTPPGGIDLVFPVAEYDHGSGCSVTGGYVYRGHRLPAWRGVYLYGDFCSGAVFGLLQNPDGSWQNARLFQTNFQISSFGRDQHGEIFLVDRSGGIYQLQSR